MQNLGLWVIGFAIGATLFYQIGFRDGDLERRLTDSAILGDSIEQEMTRHFTQENYWQDRAEACMDAHKKWSYQP